MVTRYRPVLITTVSKKTKELCEDLNKHHIKNSKAIDEGIEYVWERYRKLW
jgi:hypothetical protein